MKKTLAITSAVIMTCAALTACGETASPTTESKAETTTTTKETAEVTTTGTPEETTTTTVTTEDSETETQTEAPDEENPEETGIVTYPDNEKGLYPMSECFRRKVEEFFQQKVVSIDFDENVNTYVAICSEGIKVMFSRGNNGLDHYNSDNLFRTSDLVIFGSTDDGYDFEVVYGLNK